METLLQDIRYGLRMLLRTPGFTAVAVITLALGVGANTAVFSVVNAVLLRPAPFDDLSWLMMVWETDRNSGTAREPASAPDFLDFQRLSTSFEQMAAFAGQEVTLTPKDAAPVRLAGMAVTHNFLPMVGIRPLLGRNFSAEEDRVGGPAAAMISENLWQQRFGRDPGAIGQLLRIDDKPVTIVGVLPAAADFGALQVLSAAAYSRSFADRGEHVRVDAWVPLAPDQPGLVRDTHPLFMLGKLAPGTTAAAAQQEMATIAAQLEKTYPQANDGRGVFVEPLEKVVLGPVRPALLVLLGAVALVLLVGCANVANLVLARGTARTREVAVRAALGASLPRLARQFLTESAVLALAGGAAGVLLAYWGTNLLIALAPADIPRLSQVSIDGRVLGVTLAISALVGIAFGMVPIMQARHVDVQSGLKQQSGRSLTAGRERGRLRSLLVVLELALALVLVVSAGLLIKSFWRLIQVDPGFQTQGVLKAEFQLPESRYPFDVKKYPNLPEIQRFNQELLRGANALPGVEAAALAGAHPLDPGFTNSFVIVGREAEARNWPEISVRTVSPQYFRVTGLPLLRGRLLADSDETTAPRVAVINHAAAERFFANQDPTGQKIAFWDMARTIVGVVGDEKIQGLTKQAPIAVYVPIAQVPTRGGETLLLRVSGDPQAMAAAARSVITGIDPGLAVYGVEPLEHTLLTSVGQQRFTMLLLAAFAALAVTLAVVGVYGVLTYTTAQRTPEIAIRTALGASRRQVMGLVMRHGARLAVIGTALGLGSALAGTRLLRSLLFCVTATDPATFALVAALMMAVALLASYLPARRATRVHPMQALRYE